MIQSLIKSSTILEYMKQSNKEYTIAEISEGVNIPPSTTHRILNTLIECDYVMKDDRTHLYKLGAGLISLGIAATSNTNLQNDAYPILKDLSKEIEWIEKRRDEMLAFWTKVEVGLIPIRVTHNDTKISNILFDQKGEVLCVIDLDTVLNSTCLNDYGDAIRSYANAGLEDDKDIDNVYLKMDVFESYTQGYLSEAKAFLIDEEVNNLAFSAKYITYEQTLRFLMDYIDGDTYYKTAYDEHNLVRTHAQHKLLQSMEENFEEMKDIVSQTIKNK